MSEKYKIKTVKEYLKEGPPQFDVILRRESGKVINVAISIHPDMVEESGGARNFHFVLHPPENGSGIIQIVKRISDDAVFHQSDMVEDKNGSTCYILEFKEDLIHVLVAFMFDQEPCLIEINKLMAKELIDDEEELEDEQAR